MNLILFSDCCHKDWQKGSCSGCNCKAEPIAVCPDCEGTGKVDVIDYLRVNSTTISPPYITIECSLCSGSGFVSVEYNGDPDEFDI